MLTEMFYCPLKKKNVRGCNVDYEIKKGRMEIITCKFWKKGKGCTYEKNSRKNQKVYKLVHPKKR
jgi:hypothetical protein